MSFKVYKFINRKIGELPLKIKIKKVVISFVKEALKFFKQNYWDIPKKKYFCNQLALVVQRIERRFPKPKIWVRFPSGVQNDRFW
jgi:hypothetical protein